MFFLKKKMKNCEKPVFCLITDAETFKWINVENTFGH